MSKTLKNKSLIIKSYNQGFWRGYEKLTVKDRPGVKKCIWLILDIHNQKSFNLYLNGKQIPRADQAQEIESLFASVGVYDIWGKKS